MRESENCYLTFALPHYLQISYSETASPLSKCFSNRGEGRSRNDDHDHEKVDDEEVDNNDDDDDNEDDDDNDDDPWDWSMARAMRGVSAPS